MTSLPLASPVKKLLFPLLALAALAGATPARASSPISYCFEEGESTLQARDSGTAGYDLPCLGTSRQTGAEAKFGTGSLELGEGPLTGFGESCGASSPSGRKISRMTIMMWIKARPEGMAGQETFLLQRLGPKGEGAFTFSYSSGKRFVFYTSAAKGDNTIAKLQSEPLPTWPGGEWGHVAMTFNQGEVAFYFNGEPVGEPRMLPEEITSIPEIEGEKKGFFRSMVSSPGVSHIDDFGFWADEALSAEQIRAAGESGLKVFLESP